MDIHGKRHLPKNERVPAVVHVKQLRWKFSLVTESRVCGERNCGLSVPSCSECSAFLLFIKKRTYAGAGVVTHSTKKSIFGSS